MQSEIITIGDELLIGQVVDTNSAWMAQRLNEIGVELKQITSVHDDETHIRKALDEAFSRADIVFTTGGLGPTKDDITKLVMASYFDTRLVESAAVKKHIYELYKNRPEVLNRLTETQWMVPEKAEILENRVGSAPLMVFVRNGSGNKKQWLFATPGVPYEMKIAMEEQILPYLSEHVLSGVEKQITHRTVMVSGIPESSLAIVLEPWETALPKDIRLAYLPKDGTIRLRLSGYGVMPARVDEEKRRLTELVKEWLVAEEDKPLEVLVGERLKAEKATIATAESCTGGKLAALLNKHAGSSAFYMGSVVAYSNEVKHQVLGVSADALNHYGAVSEQVVRQMAEGVRRLMHTDYAIATSGIAGPDGGSAEKPVGTVWMAWATPEGTFAECFRLGTLREQITDRACMKALIRMLQLIK